MKIKALVENTTASDVFKSEHGLSLYIETNGCKLLFDTGQSALFSENAALMGLKLSEIEFAVISHGHYDHGGGLQTLFELNSTAKVYLNEKAFDKHYADHGERKVYAGLDEELLPNDRFVFCGESFEIGEGFELFSGVKGTRLFPSGNFELYLKSGEDYVQDDFSHEQNLIISENGKTLLVAGCAHRGIVNILEHFKSLKGTYPDYVIGGFHLYDRSSGENEDPKKVKEIGEFLAGTNSKFYTCHCTGLVSYDKLKSVMGDKIDYLSTGNEIIL